MSYLEQVKQDVRRYIEDNHYRLDELDADELNDNLWVEDSVTGNGSGSYTFSREKAKEYVLSDVDTVMEALIDFDVDKETIAEKFLAQDWEYFDVTARCAVLGQAIAEVLEEMSA